MVKHLKVVEKRCCLNWIFLSMILIFLIKYSNIEYQDDILKTYY